jgi:uncharacterized coiled-coil protein SlyX
MRTGLLVMLAIGVGCALAAEPEQEIKDLKAALAEQQKVIAALEKRIAVLEAKAPPVENPRPADARTAVQKPADAIEAQATAARVGRDLEKFVDAQATVDRVQNQDITTLAANTNKVETRVKYHDEKLKVLDQAMAGIASLQEDAKALKTEAKALRTEVTKLKQAENK